MIPANCKVSFKRPVMTFEGPMGKNTLQIPKFLDVTIKETEKG